jgi:hypothetical protein
MSKVYRCEECGLRTTEPFVIKDQTLCAICADRVDPKVVDQREAEFVRKYSAERRPLRTR